ncbi:hypothetical protein [Chengkuizengella marina]|uniref:Uncharacterized protein n=1 Tax=Chengkuizengella marina TaxID=2507566 RepID=A0A6N9Q565_9BACL|nr:hypothetical protein [Chengkuizengella marina]NBI29910.1 hypothetical protein [Chengkuizengella marina]
MTGENETVYEMDNEKLVELRKHQFILLNLTFLFILILFLVLSMLDITTKQFYFGSSILFAIQLFLYLKFGKTDVLIHTKKMKELHKYEKKKLGKEERKQRNLVIGLQFFAIVCFVMMGTITPSEKFFNLLTFSSVFYFFFVMMILVNIITFIRNRAFDRNKNLEGFTMKMFLINILFVFFIVSILVISSILLIRL